MSTYIERYLRDWVSAGTALDYVMKLPKGSRPRLGDNFIYLSMYRPLSAARNLLASKEGIVTMPVESGTKAIVLAPEPLDLDVIEEWELSPVGKAAAWALMAGSKLPIELAEVVSRGPHVRAVLIHKGTKGEPRMTYFEEEIGATGHTEGTSYEELVLEALGMGFRVVSPGIVDNIVGTIA